MTGTSLIVSIDSIGFGSLTKISRAQAAVCEKDRSNGLKWIKTEE